MNLSARAQILTRSKYSRPLNEAGSEFETWADTVARVISHQRWLWERAQGGPLTIAQSKELSRLSALMFSRASMPAGRILWMGGTEVSKRRESSLFNCAFTEVSTINDCVDVFWLLLQGAGVGFRPSPGKLVGFYRKLEVEILPSTRETKGGRETNLETFDASSGVWTIQVGDSAKAWAKSLGKLLAHPYPARKLILDFSQIRPEGTRLKGYGWISSGWGPLGQGYKAIAEVLNRRAGKLLSVEDIWDIINWLGTVLSSRRSAQIGLVEGSNPAWELIAKRKPPGFDKGPDWFKGQSNNSLLFYEKPSKRKLRQIFELMAEMGGSEPGFVNMEAALSRAPWCKGLNPCAEILLGAFCNLTETDVARYANDDRGLLDALHLIARANYRQTLVNLRDGILQYHWHEQNEYLRLCGVGLCGVVKRPDISDYDFRAMQRAATVGAYSMADEIGKERPKNVTTIKPGGTVPKIMDTTEGIKFPDARYILNRVNFFANDPIVSALRNAGYVIEPHPSISESVLAVIPYDYGDIGFDSLVNGAPVCRESAISQLERYRRIMRLYCDQNASTTIMYDREEIPQLVNWFDRNWDDVVGVSFCYRSDPTKSAADLGFAYLPQQAVDRETFERFASNLSPVDLDSVSGNLESLEASEFGPECVGGACPTR